MLKAIVNTKKPQFWILIHLLLGFACTILKEFFVLWFFTVALSSLNIIARGSKETKLVNLLYIIVYFSSLELMARITKAYLYRLPWEYGKYVVFFGAIYAITVLQTRKGSRGFLLFLLLIPAIFFTGDFEVRWRDIVFNLLGPISIAFVIISNTELKISKAQFKQLLKLLLYPAITLLAYVIIKTPDLDSMEFSLEANFEVTGGYGSNQVSTILGFGLFLCFVFWINRWDLSGNRIIDLLLMLGFFFQGLLSFSRGGMIGGALAILIYLFMITRTSNVSQKKFSLPKIGKFVLPALIALIITFQIADSVTGGLLSLRYQGETSGTLAGRKDVDINTLTTGRFDIFIEDFEIWMDNFILGTGVGISKYLRSRAGAGTFDTPIASHVELSRLLAEHGILGFTYFLLLAMLGLKLLKARTNPKYQGVLLAFFTLAMYTTFHAATRTYLTPLLIGISLVNIVDINDIELSEKELKRRKRLAAQGV